MNGKDSISPAVNPECCPVKSPLILQFVKRNAFGGTGMNLCRIRCDGIPLHSYMQEALRISLTASAAALACSSVSAATISASPNWKIFHRKKLDVQTVCLVVFWKHYKTIDLIGSACCLNIFCCDNSEYTGVLSASAVSMRDICARNLCLCKSKTKCS